MNIENKSLENGNEPSCLGAVSDSSGLFTDSQLLYANSVGEKDLRRHLLHQVRLRDNLESDRDSFEKMYNELLIKYKQQKGNGLQLEDWNNIIKGDLLILNHDNGGYKKGDEFMFKMSDGLSFIVSDKEQDIYLNVASILFFHRKCDWDKIM